MVAAGARRIRSGRVRVRATQCLAHLVAWVVHLAQVVGHCEPRTGIAPFAGLVDQVMSQEPNASARSGPSTTAAFTPRVLRGEAGLKRRARTSRLALYPSPTLPLSLPDVSPKREDGAQPSCCV